MLQNFIHNCNLIFIATEIRLSFSNCTIIVRLSRSIRDAYNNGPFHLSCNGVSPQSPSLKPITVLNHNFVLPNNTSVKFVSTWNTTLRCKTLLVSEVSVLIT